MGERATRTEAVGRAMLEELRRRRAQIDQDGDLVSITIQVRLRPDAPDPVRAVRYEDEKVRGRGARGLSCG